MQIQGVAASDRTLTDGLSRTFLVESVIEVKVVNGTYSYTVLPVAAPYLKQYSAPAAEPSSAQRTVAMAWESGELVGCIQLRMNWNGLVAIDDLAVLPHARKQGIGSALLAEAKRRQMLVPSSKRKKGLPNARRALNWPKELRGPSYREPSKYDPWNGNSEDPPRT